MNKQRPPKRVYALSGGRYFMRIRLIISGRVLLLVRSYLYSVIGVKQIYCKGMQPFKHRVICVGYF